jgi:hypothetical protein
MASKKFESYKKEIAKKYPKGVPKLKKLIIQPPTHGTGLKGLDRRLMMFDPDKVPVAKKMAKKVAKKTVGKVLKKLIPGVGGAAIAHDVLKGVSKATCSKRGGKWASGKCVGAKKTKFKPGSKVKDPISKR